MGCIAIGLHPLLGGHEDAKSPRHCRYSEKGMGLARVGAAQDTDCL